MANNEKTPTFKEKIVTYFKGVKSEWGKISWPQKPQIISETVVVAIFVIFSTIIIFLMDVIFKGILGIIPQCGFSVMATNLFSSRVITIGTLLAIYLSTSDEMLPLLLSENVSMNIIVKLTHKLTIEIFHKHLYGRKL